MNTNSLIAALTQHVHGRIDLPEHPEQLEPAPDELMHGPAAPVITARSTQGGLWKHQSLALRHLLDGRHTVVSTGTASGKSLVFQSYAYHRLGQDPDATAIVFDPLRALAEDQLNSWREAAELCGLSPDRIVKIDGSIPVPDRERRLAHAAVAIMTPDVCQAWLMRNTASRAVQQFVANLHTIVLDEAHVYDSIFGSNAGYLFRRLLTYRQAVAPPDAQPYRIIAATATISNAADHLQSLTGQPFQEISEDQNGARMFPRTILHLEGNDEDALTQVLQQVMEQPDTPKFIAFVDNRQAVERIARRLGGRVMAYRNGYEAKDRRDIELALRHSRLAGVVSTSALELGINIPKLSLGVNLKLPGTRKSFRQRLGRVGRDGPGLFIIIGPDNLFAQYGETLEQYYRASVEPSVLYLGNKFIQFANAQCLAKEQSPQLDPGQNGEPVAWPDGFDAALQYVRRGNWPDEYKAIAAMGRRNPHIAHPIRNISEVEINLENCATGQRIGFSTLEQAMRETFPGAQYIHAGRSYQAQEWDRSNRWGKITVPLQEVPYPTYAEAVKTMDIKIRGIVEQNITLHQEQSGYAAEVHAAITETVTGCIENMQLRQYPPEDRPQRRFETTGVLLRIKSDWMANPYCREQIGRMLEAITRYDCSIANWDIGHAAEPMLIASRQHPDGEHTDQAVLIYDNSHGSLRLTEALFLNFRRYVRQLEHSVEVDGEMVSKEVIQQLAGWAASLRWDD